MLSEHSNPLPGWAVSQPQRMSSALPQGRFRNTSSHWKHVQNRNSLCAMRVESSFHLWARSCCPNSQTPSTNSVMPCKPCARQRLRTRSASPPCLLSRSFGYLNGWARSAASPPRSRCLSTRWKSVQISTGRVQLPHAVLDPVQKKVRHRAIGIPDAPIFRGEQGHGQIENGRVNLTHTSDCSPTHEQCFC